MKDHIEHYTNYLKCAFEDDPRKMAATARSRLRGVKYDTMVGIGLSGALVVPALARALHKHWLIVRKHNECHSSAPAEGRLGTRWIFVDDFISTGDSRAVARKQIACYIAYCVENYNANKDFKTVEVGTYSYNENKWTKYSNARGYGY